MYFLCINFLRYTHKVPQCWFARFSVYVCILHSHNGGLHHNAKACKVVNQIGGCNSDLRCMHAMCSLLVTSEFYSVLGSAVVEDRFLCRHVGFKFHPDGDDCQQNNAVMFRPKSKLRVTRWIIGTGRVLNSGGLSIKHAAALA